MTTTLRFILLFLFPKSSKFTAVHYERRWFEHWNILSTWGPLDNIMAALARGPLPPSPPLPRSPPLMQIIHDGRV